MQEAKKITIGVYPYSLPKSEYCIATSSAIENFSFKRLLININIVVMYFTVKYLNGFKWKNMSFKINHY